ncbi:MAG: M1 family aminopeptidase [Candidatus Aminicenantales bacterium]
MTNKAARATLFFWLFFILSQASDLLPAGQGLDDLAAKLRASIMDKNSTAYVDFFAPAIREQEAVFQRRLFEIFTMDRASFFLSSEKAVAADDGRVFFQAIFENDYSAFVQYWELRLERNGGGWLIADKLVRGDLGLLYKIKLPSERVELASRVEISHQDISLTFTNALVFYDNIPGLETALLVMGPGLVSYRPSDPKEEHQLELAYRTRQLQEKIEYAFCRFSDSFFNENIRIEQNEASRPVALSEAVRTRAAALFDKHYPRFFTVVSSLGRERLSFLPQGEEAILEFQTSQKKEFSYIFTPFAQEEIHLIEQPRQRLINLYSPPGQGAGKNMFISFQEKFDVQHYDLEVRFWPQTTWLSVRARVFVLSNRDSLDSLKFRLNRDLEIVRILDSKGRELFYTQDKLRDLLYIYLLESCNQNTIFSLDIHYRGRLLPPEQTTDIVSAGQFGETLILTPPRYDSFLFSRSAAWYPEPSEEDYFTAQQSIIVPPEYSCQANGLLQERSTFNGPPTEGEPNKSGRVMFVFNTQKPVKYLSFIVGDFDLEGEIAQPLPVSYYVTSNMFLRKLTISTISEILDFYEALFGPFPYEKLAVIHRLWSSGGGHSPASFAVLNELPRSVESNQPFLNAASPVDLSRWKEYFVAHEIAHQWWGQGLTWKSYRDQWLSEGLAQFGTTQFLRRKYGERTYTSIMDRFCQWTDKLSVWGQISLGSRLSFLNFDAYQAILYNKTSAVLNLLQEIIGPEAFWSGIRDFFSRHRYGAASTGDFIQAMEQASGRKLDVFFGPWFDSYTLPEARIILSEVKKGQERFLQVEVNQKSDVFIFPLWLEWSEAGNKINRKIIVETKEASFSLPFRGWLAEVKVNPVRLVPGRLTVVR